MAHKERDDYEYCESSKRIRATCITRAPIIPRTSSKSGPTKEMGDATEPTLRHTLATLLCAALPSLSLTERQSSMARLVESDTHGTIIAALLARSLCKETTISGGATHGQCATWLINGIAPSCPAAKVKMQSTPVHHSWVDALYCLVFSMLALTDRANAACVNRTWLREVSSPRTWRTSPIHFSTLSQMMNVPRVFPACLLARSVTIGGGRAAVRRRPPHSRKERMDRMAREESSEASAATFLLGRFHALRSFTFIGRRRGQWIPELPVTMATQLEALVFIYCATPNIFSTAMVFFTGLRHIKFIDCELISNVIVPAGLRTFHYKGQTKYTSGIKLNAAVATLESIHFEIDDGSGDSGRFDVAELTPCSLVAVRDCTLAFEEIESSGDLNVHGALGILPALGASLERLDLAGISNETLEHVIFKKIQENQWPKLRSVRYKVTTEREEAIKSIHALVKLLKVGATSKLELLSLHMNTTTMFGESVNLEMLCTALRSTEVARVIFIVSDIGQRGDFLDPGRFQYDAAEVSSPDTQAYLFTRLSSDAGTQIEAIHRVDACRPHLVLLRKEKKATDVPGCRNKATSDEEKKQEPMSLVVFHPRAGGGGSGTCTVQLRYYRSTALKSIVYDQKCVLLLSTKEWGRQDYLERCMSSPCNAPIDAPPFMNASRNGDDDCRAWRCSCCVKIER